MAEVVSVAMQFAPAMECYKHMRVELGLLSEDTGDEAPVDDSETVGQFSLTILRAKEQ